MDRLFKKLMILLGIIGLSHCEFQMRGSNETSFPEQLNPNWMANIPDNQLLSAVTMPGTHNTMALYGGVYAKCQTWSLTDQLLAGVRYLDIRVRHINGNLTIHHGISYQRAHFGQVLTAVADFLTTYPTETVLMRVKEEFSETNNIYAAVVQYIHRYINWHMLWHSGQVPTMGSVRGKIIILRDFSGPDLGIRYNSLDIADHWKVPTYMHLGEKWHSVYNHLEAALSGNMGQIFLTYSSGAGILAHPTLVASKINPQLLNYLLSKTDKNQRFGIICMDFPTSPLIQLIINFQLAEVRTQKKLLDLLNKRRTSGLKQLLSTESKSNKKSG